MTVTEAEVIQELESFRIILQCAIEAKGEAHAEDVVNKFLFVMQIYLYAPSYLKECIDRTLRKRCVCILFKYLMNGDLFQDEWIPKAVRYHFWLTLRGFAVGFFSSSCRSLEYAKMQSDKYCSKDFTPITFPNLTPTTPVTEDQLVAHGGLFTLSMDAIIRRPSPAGPTVLLHGCILYFTEPEIIIVRPRLAILGIYQPARLRPTTKKDYLQSYRNRTQPITLEIMSLSL